LFIFSRQLAATALLLLVLATHAVAQDHDRRESSGTAWQPAATPMAGVHATLGGWMLMGHANVFAQFLYESGEVHRTSHQAGSINWFMGSARRQAGRGRLGLRAMFSAEPWTIAGCGYPNLLATGEVCDGDTIHDRQHPHDLFMELAAGYDRPIAGGVLLHVYAGLAGEPALGPPGFPHRASAMPNPIAPIAHHWLDSTHIAFGVVTAGLSGPEWRVEASAFNGREPDDQRLGLELAPLDSVSARIAFSPGDRWAWQISAGHLNESEAGLGSQPRQDVDRATASAMYSRALNSGATWASTFAYGVNRETSAIPGGTLEQTTHAVLAESSLRSPSGRHNSFGRFEIVGKPAHDLHAHEYITQVFTVGKVQAGYLRQFRPIKGWVPGVGGHLNLSLLPPLLAPRYNGRIAPGVGVFGNLRTVG
jgi:hypothetical protein